MTRRQRWVATVLFAVAMAMVESAVVLYLRIFLNRLDPYQAEPLTAPAWLVYTEMAREAATLIMLVTVGWLAGQTWRSRLGYFFIAFGVWDIFYYVFLVLLAGWPRSLLDWDILFLLPLPWWGPVLAPISIAALMSVGGTLICQCDARQGAPWPGRWSWGLSLGGTLVALYVFMADALTALGQGLETVHRVLPVWFNWPLFSVALALMSAPVLEICWQRWEAIRRTGDR